MALALRYVARSDAGLVRDVNEDSGYAGPYVLAVADGMGGHAAGEVASQAAIEELVQAEDELGDRDPLEALGDALHAANDRIRQLVHDDPSREGMGTTATAFFWTGEALAMGHIGDSRAYLLHDDELRQITHDHTFVQTLIDEGRISPEEASVHPARSFILKALQGQPDLEPDFELVSIVVGDRLLICSDGLDNARVSDDTIATALRTISDPEEAADELVRLARAGGAPDNVTVVIADVLQADKPLEPDDTVEAYLVGAAAENMADGGKRPRRWPGAALRNKRSSEVTNDFEEQRYAPQAPRRFRWFRALVIIAAIVAIGWAGLTLAKGWVDDQYYVGTHNGEVAVFQGVSQEIGPFRLSSLYEQPGGLPVAALPDVYQALLDETIAADNADDAMATVERLRANACEAHTPDADDADTNEEPARTTEAGATRDPKPKSTRSPEPSPEPTPEPEPEPTFDGLECPE